MSKPPLALPCSSCGTTAGSLRSNGKSYARYLGQRFGFDGVLCSTCRAREGRHAKAISEGRVPGRPGRTPKPKPVSTRKEKAHQRQEAARCREAECDRHLAAVLPERIRAVRELAEVQGRWPRRGETKAECKQREWADRAATERRLVVESRHRSHVIRTVG